MQHLRFDALQTSHHEERLWNGHEDGATVIDVDVIDGMLDNVAAMEKFLKIPVTEPDVSKIQFMTDSFKFRPDLTCIYRQEPRSRSRDRIGCHRAEKLRFCKRSYDILVSDVGLPVEDIIFFSILTVFTGMEEHSNYGVDSINACRIIKE
ncbi:putative methionine synthase [Phytophthora infestans]|uniref:Putative methionine synthase n=1 Tax=Phytophthora infestans TaxID=4787 RepID=A0A8S9U0A0_PHYIN|nr:putative methionine synthase [Phytophthora infestans]